jgi:tRNA G10  N-methylase Trm11
MILADGDRPLSGADLDFNGRETQHSTHAIHPYVAAINPPLARTLIENYVPVGGRVLDPFCGGGGVLVESILSGRSPVGLDVNPLARIISSAKTTHIHYGRLRSAYEEIQEKAQPLLPHSRPPSDPNLTYWFTPRCLEALTALSQAVNQVAEPDSRMVFQTALSAAARDVMLTYRGEVRLRRLEPEDLKRFRPDAFISFGKRAELAIQRVSGLPEGSKTDVKLADAKTIPCTDHSFDAVICSPPYADDTNGVGYFQFSKYMLLWLGWSNEMIAEWKRRFLGGNHREGLAETPPSTTLANALSLIRLRSEDHASVVTKFYSDYLVCLREMFRVSRKWVIIVIGNRVISRTAINNGQVTFELCNSFGGELHDYYTRSIRKKRIKDLGGDGGGTTGEHILIFRNGH